MIEQFNRKFGFAEEGHVLSIRHLKNLEVTNGKTFWFATAQLFVVQKTNCPVYFFAGLDENYELLGLACQVKKNFRWVLGFFEQFCFED